MDPGSSPLAQPDGTALVVSTLQGVPVILQLKREDPLCTLTCSLLGSGVSQMKNSTSL